MLGLLGNILGPVLGIIDKAVPDKDLREKLKAELTREALDADSELNKAAASIIIAEAQGESAAQRNWRPHLMYLIMGLLVFNGAVVPLVSAIWDIELPVLEAWSAIPSEMWTLLQIGLGGYIVGRSGEKIAKSWKR